jgi:hypothetical protein
MDASVHSLVAGDVDEAPAVGSLPWSSELEGVPRLGVADAVTPWVGVADAVARLEDGDEHPVTNASEVPPTAKRSAALVTVECFTMNSKGSCARDCLLARLECYCACSFVVAPGWAVTPHEGDRTSTGERDLSRSPVDSASTGRFELRAL